jgi:uroporphyrin-III C-methyltransferase
MLIMENALKHGHVVRLKGGDPFVFGRGQEEIEYAEAFNIKTAMVPGISSSISVPALQGIPVTRRHTSESFWVLTGTTKAGELSEDISLAAQSTATLVILMGTRKLEQIADIFKSIGKENIPVAVIQNGSLKNEKIAIGTIANIAHQVKEKAISSPAVIVIGEVVKYHPEFNYEFVEKNYLS